MKKVFCSQYTTDDCCDTCHMHEEYYKSVYKGIEISHCCSSLQFIKWDIDQHQEEKPENDCQ
jgi:hypothetical protein